MRRRRQHLQRPVTPALQAGLVELGDGSAEAAGIAADFVDRQEQVEAVEGRVFEPLRLDRPGVLLQLHGEPQPLARVLLRQRRIADAPVVGQRSGIDVARQHHLAEEVEQRRFHRRVAPPRAGDGAFHDGAVFGSPALFVDVGAVVGEAGDDLGDDLAQTGAREVPRLAAALRDAVEHVREHRQLTRHRRIDDQPFARVEHVVEGLDAPGELGVRPAQLPRLAGVDVQAVEIVEVVVAGRAVHRPAPRQRFAARQNLLGHHVQRPIRASAALGLARDVPGLRRQVLQHREVSRRVEQAVGMIDADRLHLAVGEKGLQELVRVREDRGILDSQPGKRVDVEEPPVVDLVEGRAPIGQAIRLHFQQLVQRIEAVGPAGFAVEYRDHRLDRIADSGRLRDQPRQTSARDFLLTLPDGHALRLRVGVRRQVLELRDDAQVLLQQRVVGAEHLSQRPDGLAVDARRLARVDRQLDARNSAVRARLP